MSKKTLEQTKQAIFAGLDEELKQINAEHERKKKKNDRIHFWMNVSIVLVVTVPFLVIVIMKLLKGTE